MHFHILDASGRSTHISYKQSEGNKKCNIINEQSLKLTRKVNRILRQSVPLNPELIVLEKKPHLNTDTSFAKEYSI